MSAILVHHVEVPKSAIDLNGHVNNIEYLRWMQEAAMAHSAAGGWDLARYLVSGTSWVVRSHHIDYLRPAFAGEDLQLLTWIAGFDESSSPRRSLIRRERDGAVVARAETVWVYVDGRSGRPLPIPPEFRGAFPVIADDEEALRRASLADQAAASVG